MGMLLSRDPEHQNTRINFSSPQEGEEGKRKTLAQLHQSLVRLLSQHFNSNPVLVAGLLPYLMLLDDSTFSIFGVLT